MLISRGVNLLNHISKHAGRKNMLSNMQLTRFSHDWHYRPYGQSKKHWELTAEFFGGVIWWWILYRMYYDFAHITGHWEYPDVSKWTNEELGIPPDDSNS